MDTQSTTVVDLTVADETSATLLLAHVVTADEAAAFTSPNDFYYDDGGPVFQELLNRCGESFCKIRSALPYIIKLHEIVEALPRDKFNRLATPILGKYTWQEICHDFLQRDPRTIRRLLEEPKSPKQMADEKAARLHAQRVKNNAAALAAHNAATSTGISITGPAGNVIPVELHEKILKQVAETEAAKAATVTATELEKASAAAFADGVSAQQAFVEKQEAAANTGMETFYTLAHGGDPQYVSVDLMRECHFRTLAESQSARKRKKYKDYGVVKVDAVYTYTPHVPLASSPKLKKPTKAAEISAKLGVQS
jgi:pyruvate/2-oxoglutarate dehydrogenase complex dihydrolipoamide acyltransferase (E2) component